MFTYPVIYIRGGRLAGGYTELQALADGADGLDRALSRLVRCGLALTLTVTLTATLTLTLTLTL